MRYEYRQAIVPIPSGTHDERDIEGLNALGAEGWRVMSAEIIHSPMCGPYWECLLERVIAIAEGSAQHATT